MAARLERRLAAGIIVRMPFGQLSDEELLAVIREKSGSEREPAVNELSRDITSGWPGGV
jgi:hypothetical protein